ncbi:Uncharacterized protein Adt_11874 [Abeliophyllum distichum]|uniref:Integrase catalytic domain-containing protein n=1 Tax=Abeliophyllum distichum TaxID=126358 RepID=A0ABD1UQK4_9LAMI
MVNSSITIVSELFVKFTISRLTLVTHPRSNGQAKEINQTIVRDLKTRLDKEKRLCADELSNVLWAYHTSPKEPTGETPFKMSFGMEAVVPIEILSKTDRLNVEQLNPVARCSELDLLKWV